MFEALAIAFTLSGPVKIEDTRGPYVDEQHCKERLIEMRDHAATMMPLIKWEGYCIPNGDQAA